VHAERCGSTTQPTTTAINTLTATWIRRHVAFRWLEMDSADFLKAEPHLRRKWRPTLNTLQEYGSSLPPRRL
jgi:hypothetical protein